MTQPSPRRTLIGTAPTLVERVKVFRTDDALEVEYVTTFEISRRRVFFDEIVLVLLHRSRTSPLVQLAWTVLLLGAIGAALAKLFLLLIPIAALLGAFAVVGYRSWTVTAYGRRSFARMRYGLREEKARRVFDEICQRAVEAQNALAARTYQAGPAIETPLEEPPPAPPSRSDEAWPALPPAAPGDGSSG